MRPELLKLLLEKLLLIIGNGLLVQDQDLGDIIIVNLTVLLVRINAE